MRILLVEDDELLGSGISEALNRCLYPHEWLRDGASALQAARVTRHDLIILDLGLPKMDGIEVLRQLRAYQLQCAVLIISARNQSKDRIEGLNLGADDYISKPFEIEELVARIRAIERRMVGRAQNAVELGRLRLSLDTLEVRLDGVAVELQRREFMLLKRLMEAPSQIHSRGQLEAAVYGNEGDVESNSIDVHVHHLRKKLYPEVVKTIRGVGYRLDAGLALPA
jgi:two-component system response regulator QseB